MRGAIKTYTVEMATKTSSCRISGESLKKIEKRAEIEGIPFSSAVKRTLDEALAIDSGKPLVRWGVVDPDSTYYSLALHEVVVASKAITALITILNQPRPKTPDEAKQDAEIRDLAKKALARIDSLIDQLRRRGRLLMPRVTPDQVRAALKNHKPGSVEWELMTAFLGERAETLSPEVKK